MITEDERRKMNDRRKPGDPFVRALTEDGKGYYIGTMYPGESVSEFTPINSMGLVTNIPVNLIIVVLGLVILSIPVMVCYLLLKLTG